MAKSAEQKYIDKIDALAKSGVINDDQVNDLENVVMNLTNGKGELGGSNAGAKKIAIESAIRAAANQYK
jgi:hypothetical protein